MTSSRRWKNSGVLKTSLKNQLVLAAYFAGISPHRLARWYYGPSETKGRIMTGTAETNCLYIQFIGIIKYYCS